MIRMSLILRSRIVSLFVVAILLALFTSFVHNGTGNSADYKNKIYLPLIIDSNYRKFIGIYMAQYWTSTSVPQYMSQADNLAGLKHSVTGWFINLQDVAFTSIQNNVPNNNFYRQVEALWQNGYISFINVDSAQKPEAWVSDENCPIPFSANQVATGACDRAIQKMADLYYAWVSQGGGRRAFLAPLQEMNGYWVTYGYDPEKYKLAFKRIQDIFAAKGITRSQVWWVFAPNAWSVPEHLFEYYYPGNDYVDVLAFSSYNAGYCWAAYPWQRWENYNTLYQPYIDRMNVMAPAKPIIIAQTGSTAEYSATGNYMNDKKNEWLIMNYNWIVAQPSVLGVLYFDINDSCVWELTQSGNVFSSGYKGAAKPFLYLTVQDIQDLIGP